MSLITEVDHISPEQAKHLLDQNINNRPMNVGHVRSLADQMRRGEWKMDYTPIRIAESGRLLDGQHRLQAIVDSGMGQDLFMVYGLDESTFTVIDTGRSRTAGDTLYIAGVKDHIVKAALIRMILNYERSMASYKNTVKKRTPKLPVTNQEILDFSATVDLSDYVKKAARWGKEQAIYTKVEYGFFYYLLSHIDKPVAEKFLEGIATGVGLQANSPMYVLREKLIKYKASKIVSSGIERLGLTFKAWNLYRDDEACPKMLVYDFERDGLILPQ